MRILHVNLDDLVHAKSVESERREFKKSWDEPVREAVIRTICAFANDLHNLNGGYVIIGIEDQRGKPVLPPSGLDDLDMDQIQKEIRGRCKRLDPEYQPILSPETYMDRQILVVWAPGGDVRPYQAPKRGGKGADRTYFVRIGSETIEAKGEVLTQLLQLTARVPYDDRRRSDSSLDDISGSLVRKFLADVNSDLVAPGANLSTGDLLRSLRLAAKTNSSEVPRNVALLFFSENPEQYFPGTRIEVVQFGDDAGGDLVEEKTFRGPLPQMTRQVLDFLGGVSSSVIRKVPQQAEAKRFVAFPFEAMEEALVNAVFHRSYEFPPEPVKVYLYPDRMEITSYPGPVPGLERHHFNPNERAPQLAARNRRIGEFLKELRLAEMRGTGIPMIRRKMAENGSPEPTFEFDEQRAYFRVILPAHPGYVVLHALRESAQLWATGEREKARAHLAEARKKVPGSGVLVAQSIDYAAASDDMTKAKALLIELEQIPGSTHRHLAYIALSRAYLDRQQKEEAIDLLQNVPRPQAPQDEFELAILYKRSGQYEKAHRLFASAYEQLDNDPKAVHEYAQTKIKLASKIQTSKSQDRQAKRKLNQQAAELLRRTIQLADNDTRAAWAWFDLARTLSWLKAPESEIRGACEKAIEIEPEEKRFKDWISDRFSPKGR